jgi:hypothetical protein
MIDLNTFTVESSSSVRGQMTVLDCLQELVAYVSGDPENLTSYSVSAVADALCILEATGRVEIIQESGRYVRARPIHTP